MRAAPLAKGEIPWILSTKQSKHHGLPTSTINRHLLQGASPTLPTRYESLPNYSLQSCLDLLSSKDLDLNRVGLQRLNSLTTSSRLQSESFSSVLVFGAPLGTTKELLRFFFVTMICDVNDSGGRDSFCSVTSETSLVSEASLGHPRGKAGGIFHNHAIRILANALCRMHEVKPSLLSQLPLEDDLWKSIIVSLVENIEANHSTRRVLYSMKILHSLCFARPDFILPLIKNTLFGSLVYLQDYGEAQGLPMLSKEAAALLSFAQSKR